MKTILVIGATGQIGSELTPYLRSRYGADKVIATRHRRPATPELEASGPMYDLDVRDRDALDGIVAEHHVDTMFHLASLLSAVAENRPQLAWDINMTGLFNVLEVARKHACGVFFPSSIGAFGPLTPATNTPQDTIQRPTTMYGITKVAGELLCDYYHKRFSLDTRGVRYPGLISALTPPGGGTTDYAVEIFRAAVTAGRYECFLAADTQLDMMYMPDAIAAAVQLMEADPDRLVHRNGYNITAMSFSPGAIAREIRRHLPRFEISYRIDPVRQSIADSWPRHMDDSAARREWDWQAEFDLAAMVADMLRRLGAIPHAATEN